MSDLFMELLEPLFTVGFIIMGVCFIYAYQMRNDMYKEYTNSCDIIYYPEDEKPIDENEVRMHESKEQKFLKEIKGKPMHTSTIDLPPLWTRYEKRIREV